VEEKERDKGRGGRDEQEVNKKCFQPHDEAVVGLGRYADQVLSNEQTYLVHNFPFGIEVEITN
jgi:hypothetical protein